MTRWTCEGDFRSYLNNLRITPEAILKLLVTELLRWFSLTNSQGQQQQQLGVLQQQLQTVQDLLVQLVARDPRDPPPVAVGTAVPQPIAPVPVIPAAPVPVTPVTPAPVGTPSDAVTMVPKAEIRPAIKAPRVQKIFVDVRMDSNFGLFNYCN